MMAEDSTDPVHVRRHGDIAMVEIDNPPVNATGHAVRAGLVRAIEATNAMDIHAVVLVCAGRTFVAGADIREFGRPAEPPHLPDVIAMIESASHPWVAAIHGTALGGGLELAMGCHVRIAAPDAKLGLPEVNIGVIPGAGATVRLPRLVPALRALDMIAGGKPIAAAAALADGLVDAIAEGDLREAAFTLARTLDATPVPTLSRAPNQPLDKAAFDAAAGKIIARAKGQPAPAEAIAALRRGLSEPPWSALAEERATFLRLRDTPEAAALRHIFFAERSAGRLDRLKGVAPGPLDRIGIVGGGTMGTGIATACLLSGLSVTLAEQEAGRAEQAGETIRKTLQGAEARGKLAPGGADKRAAALTISTDSAALSDCDLVIEAVFEDMGVKRAVIEALDGVLRTDAVIATNTSYLDVKALASGSAHPARVLGLHFFSPAHIMRLLEIVVPDTVSDTALATATALARRLGKIAVHTGVADGFIANRIMSAYRHAAFLLLQQGASPWQVDRVMRDFGWPMGIFEMQDLAGLDIGWAMRKRRAATHPAETDAAAVADHLCEMRRFGRKTGRGFYLYPEGGKPGPDPEVDRLIEEDAAAKGHRRAPMEDAEVLRAILSALWAEADACLADGTAQSADDIDVVMVHAFGFPRHKGGPMHFRAAEGGTGVRPEAVR